LEADKPGSSAKRRHLLDLASPAGTPIAEIEKAASKLAAEAGRLRVHAVAVGTKVAIGAPLAHVGPDLAAIESARRVNIEANAPAAGRTPAATAFQTAILALGAIRAGRRIGRHRRRRAARGDRDL